MNCGSNSAVFIMAEVMAIEPWISENILESKCLEGEMG